MSCRCKPGDLAVVVRCDIPENLGKVCTVLEAANLPQLAWVVEFPRPIRWLGGAFATVGVAYDSLLRPLRDNDGVDEMVARAGKPWEVRT